MAEHHMAATIVQLAQSRPDLRDQIDELANRAWLAVVWTLREGLTESGSMIGKDNWPLALVQERAEGQFGLLRMFLAGAVPDTSRWSGVALTEQLEQSIYNFASHLAPDQDQSLTFYREVAAGLREALTATVRSTTTSFMILLSLADSWIILIDLADSCFGLMVELEQLHRNLAAPDVEVVPPDGHSRVNEVERRSKGPQPILSSTVTPDEAEKFLDLREVAQILRVGRAAVQIWAKQGRIPAVKVGKSYRVRQRDLEAWFATQRAAPATPVE